MFLLVFQNQSILSKELYLVNKKSYSLSSSYNNANLFCVSLL